MSVCVTACKGGALDACGGEGGYGLSDAMTKNIAAGCHLIYSVIIEEISY